MRAYALFSLQISKYGLNQWARISSLLVRKSAKQCKARWHEWLDPGIKKTEWTRDEDERLLHLAKLMPTQWRTIAPIVGRTSAQCLERYEKLLDAAVSHEEGYDGGDDPRRLRPGEIDPNPESKPARPDPVDMEEDEKEMLSEARARLANTRGKKAKRKAREKGLEEARRLASLQKRRELKAAGIVSRGGGRRVQGIDYNAEIAFEKKAPAGFFDTSSERAAEAAASDKPFKPVTLAELEGTRRKDIEDALMRRDAKRQKVLERHDTPAALAQLAAALGDAEGGRATRSRLMLPPPSVSEAEMLQIARLGAASDLRESIDEHGNTATAALLADYAPSAGATPMRTPRVRAPGAGGDYILAETQNLARLQAGATPLLGGANPVLHPSSFSGATPRKPHAVAPTPVQPASASSTPARLRDGLAINAEPEEAAGGRAAEKSRAAQAVAALRLGLNALPAPRNEYVVVLPDAVADADDDIYQPEEDAADVAARTAAERAEAAALERRMRSAVVQRGLPRPAAPPGSLVAAGAPMSGPELLIRAEMLQLLKHDAAAYPVDGSAAGQDEPLSPFTEAQLCSAGALVCAEAAVLSAELGHDTGLAAHGVAFEVVRAQTEGVPTAATLRARLDLLREDMSRDARRGAKLEARASLLIAAHVAKAEELQVLIHDTAVTVSQRTAELCALRTSAASEGRAMLRRPEAAKEALATARAREAALQARFAALRHTLG